LSAVQSAATALRIEALARPDGSLLGSEDELTVRFGISRPTLRQAARLLEHQQLLVVHRGVGGGYYSRRPGVETVSMAAAAYLNAQGATLRDVIAVVHSFAESASRLAATSNDEELRGALKTLFERLVGGSAAENPLAQYFSDDAEIARLLFAMSRNPALELFNRVAYDFGFHQKRDRLFHNDAVRRNEWRRVRLQIVQAILDRDPGLAGMLTQRGNRLISNWIESDLGAGQLSMAIPNTAPSPVLLP
jgi:GntR family transcriptional repressor for pyruvate dehydrogenase complex